MKSSTTAGLHFSRRVIPAAVATVLLALGASMPAQAATAETPDWSEATKFWTEYGVDAAIQASLLDNLESGIFPDSMTGGEVVSTYEVITDEATSTVATYEDGSIFVTSTETPVEGTAGRGVSGCTVSSYTGVTYYTGCRISGQAGLVGLSFVTSFIIVNSSYDQISNSGATPQSSCAGCTSTQPTMTYYKAVENSGGPATLQYATQWTSIPPVASGTVVLTLSVGGNSYSTPVVG